MIPENIVNEGDEQPLVVTPPPPGPGYSTRDPAQGLNIGLCFLAELRLLCNAFKTCVLCMISRWMLVGPMRKPTAPSQEERPSVLPAGNDEKGDDEPAEDDQPEPAEPEEPGTVPDGGEDLEALTPGMQTAVRSKKVKKLRKLMSRKLKGKPVKGKKMKGKKRRAPARGDDEPEAENEGHGGEEPIEPEDSKPPAKKRRASKASSSCNKLLQYPYSLFSFVQKYSQTACD